MLVRRKGVVLLVALMLAILAFAVAGTPGLAQGAAVPGIEVGGQQLVWGECQPVLAEGRVLVPVAALATALGATAEWLPEQQTVWITGDWRSDAIRFDLKNQKAFVNGQAVDPGVPARASKGRVYAPVRFVAEALGASVEWDGRAQVIRITPASPLVVDRVHDPAFPARAAVISDGYLWIVDGTVAGSKPAQVTSTGWAEIIGWSPDGNWLSYLQSPKRESYSSENYLWAVRADGSGAFQVDQEPVKENAAWSPVANLIAYQTEDPGSEKWVRNLKLARLVGDSAEVETLLPEGSDLFDLAWAPDGESLAVSFPRTKDHPLHVERVTLDGECTNLFSIGKEVSAEDDLYSYPWAAQGFKWSPDGRYLAYFLRSSSGSLSADGVGIEVRDLQNPAVPIDLGSGLMYPEWLAWSPDSTQLAYIQGGGREATVNKQLCIVNMEDGKVSECGLTGQVDTHPAWTPVSPYGVLFCRGAESLVWDGDGSYSGVLVPGQRIWLQPPGGEAYPLTEGTADTADYYPAPSPDGKSLIFLGLQGRDSGSLSIKDLASGKEQELLKGLCGSAGYYGNYLPAWVSLYWEQE